MVHTGAAIYRPGCLYLPLFPYILIFLFFYFIFFCKFGDSHTFSTGNIMFLLSNSKISTKLKTNSLGVSWNHLKLLLTFNFVSGWYISTNYNKEMHSTFKNNSKWTFFGNIDVTQKTIPIKWTIWVGRHIILDKIIIFHCLWREKLN